MAKLLTGKEVVAALNENIKNEVVELSKKGIFPTLGIIRIGERADDISYEKGAARRCETLGVGVEKFVLSKDASQEEVLETIETVNQNKLIHGVLLFCPLPKHLDEAVIKNALSSKKDVDGITESSMASVYAGTQFGFPPCTPHACMEILEHYNIPLKGKNAVVIGRSLVVGKPVSMMLLQKNCTVTICHTKTENIETIVKNADIVIVATGQAEAAGISYFSKQQTVIDVGINVNSEGKLCGDVKFDEVEPVVGAITPVPGGVGTVTTSVLVNHVVKAAKREMLL